MGSSHVIPTITEAEVNVLAQRFYEASGLTLSHGHDKPKVVAGLIAVLGELSIEVRP